MIPVHTMFALGHTTFFPYTLYLAQYTLHCPSRHFVQYMLFVPVDTVCLSTHYAKCNMSEIAGCPLTSCLRQQCHVIKVDRSPVVSSFYHLKSSEVLLPPDQGVLVFFRWTSGLWASWWSRWSMENHRISVKHLSAPWRSWETRRRPASRTSRGSDTHSHTSNHKVWPVDRTCNVRTVSVVQFTSESGSIHWGTCHMVEYGCRAPWFVRMCSSEHIYSGVWVLMCIIKHSEKNLKLPVNLLLMCSGVSSAEGLPGLHADSWHKATLQCRQPAGAPLPAAGWLAMLPGTPGGATP